jgi:2,3-diketo-5-methylthio-1-phosphopentane phosphatase
MSSIKVILCDIEGTTTDISFVKDVLFPYARDNCKSFLNENFDDPEIQTIIKDLCDLAIRDENPIVQSDDKETFVDSIVENIHQQIKEDRKTKELKNLQGKIWKVAFESGKIKGNEANFTFIKILEH